MVGTRRKAFTFDGPVITDVGQGLANAAPSTHASVTISGLNFGSFSTKTPTASIDTTDTCTTTSWTSGTTVMCDSMEQSSSGKRVLVTVSTNVGTFSSFFSFDAPTVSAVAPLGSNGATTGGTFVTISGLNFAGKSYTPTMAINARTLCGTTTWTSATTLGCTTSTLSPGVGLKLSLHATVSTTVGTGLSLFTFDAPTVSFALTPNGPSTQHMSLTLHGHSFGTTNLSPSVRIQTTTCASQAWISQTMIVCMRAEGYGPKRSLSITLSAVVGTRVGMITFDAPVFTSTSPYNIMLSGTGSLTLAGFNFGYEDATPTSSSGVGYDRDSCMTTSWISTTNVLCASSSQGYGGAKHSVTVTVAAVVGTRSHKFTYDAPVLSYLPDKNLPASGSSTITIQGLNFGSVAPTPTATTSDVYACATSSWTSGTTVQCAMGTEHGKNGYQNAGYRPLLTVTALVGTRQRQFTFDAPAVSSAVSNTATSGAVSVTISGLNFGSWSVTPTLSIGGSKCTTTQWTSATTLACGSTGYGSSVRVGVTLSTVVGTVLNIFTFDAPVVSGPLQMNGPPKVVASPNDLYITVTGANFASVDPTFTATLSNTICSTSIWTTASSVRCALAGGMGTGHRVTISVGAVVGTKHQWFTFDAPIITKMLPPNIGTIFTGSVTITGTNFGQSDTTPTGAFGATMCSTTVWSTDTSVSCYSNKPGAGRASVKIYVGAIVGTRTAFFTYNSPIITWINPYNSATSGGVTLTVDGANFAFANLTPTAQVGERVCDAVRFCALLCSCVRT